MMEVPKEETTWKLKGIKVAGPSQTTSPTPGTSAGSSMEDNIWNAFQESNLGNMLDAEGGWKTKLLEKWHVLQEEITSTDL